MNQLIILLPIITLFLSVNAFDFSDPLFDKLPNVKSLGGIHSLTIERHTPPSMQTINWWILIKRDSKDPTMIDHTCPENSFICGETFIVLDDDKNNDQIHTQLISFDDTNVNIEEIENEQWKLTSTTHWGEQDVPLVLTLKCDVNANDDLIQWTNYKTGMVIGDNIELEWSNAKFCSSSKLKDGDNNGNDNKTPPNDNDNNNDDEGLGWFTILFLFSLVIFAGYLVTQAWFNTSTMGNSNDFLNELFDVVVDSLSKIPHFIGEVISKITGGGNRGGYSAV